MAAIKFLTGADIPTTGLTVGGVTSAALGEANLGLATLTNHGVLLAAGAGAFTALALDAATTKYLKSGGASAGPSWATIPVADVTGAAPLASPTFTGTATMPLVRLTAGSYTASVTDISTTVSNTFATTANMLHRNLDLSPTDTWSVASNVALMYSGINIGGTFVNDSAAGIDLGPVVAFQANYVKRIDTQTGRSMGAFDTDFNAGPSYTVANSGTFTSATHTSYASNPVLNAGSSTMTAHTGLSSKFTATLGTLTTLTHINLVDATGAGTVTTQVGIDIAAFAKAGTNIGIRNKANTQLGSSAQLTVDTSGNLATSGSMLSSGTGGVGYASGAGGTVTQGTSRTTTVVNNHAVGTITLFSATLAADTDVSFTLTNSTIAAADVLVFNIISGAAIKGGYSVNAIPAAGSATITVHNHTPTITATEAPVIAFAVIKGVTA